MFDALCRRFPWLRTPLAVHQRVGDVGGGPLASSIALAGFLSLFPLLLVGIAILGFVSANDVDFAGEVVEQLGLTGQAADQMLDALAKAEDSRRAASVLGLAGLLWGGLGVVGTLQQAFNTTWQVTGRGWTSKLVELGWLAGAGALFLVSVLLGPVAAWLPGPAAVPTVVAGFALDTVLFLWMFRTLTNVTVPWRDHLPGALLGAVGLNVLKHVGTLYVPRAVASASALYGSLGVVFAVLAWLALAARLVVYSSAYNVIRHERRHGTVTVEIKVPHIEGEVPLEATRGGAVAETAEAPGRSATPAADDQA
ncbi:MAG TPA: YihY/virulence factor BrkB family protein [Acidimicrobiales bacterium]|nr:YihY/virulence factor BrkB family protein [Acidimicrobiales bacterium]